MIILDDHVDELKNLKIEMKVNKGLYIIDNKWQSNISFYLQLIWLQTLVSIDSESCHGLFPSICTLLSGFILLCLILGHSYVLVLLTDQ